MKKGDERTGVERIALERARQISEEDYDEHHDDEHDSAEIAMAAACYAASAAGERVYVMEEFAASVSFKDPWPWDEHDDKRPYDGNVLQEPESDAQRIRMLEKAGALIAAEIDRLLRKQTRARVKKVKASSMYGVITKKPRRR